MQRVDPLARHVCQSSAIIAQCQHFSLEPPHLACGRGLSIHSPSTHDLAHHWIERQTVSVIDALVACKATEHRLTQKSDKGVNTIEALTRALEKPASHVVQAEHFVQFAIEQQTAVRADLGAVKFQPDTAVKTKPDTPDLRAPFR